MNREEDAFKKTFDECLEAARNPQDHVLVAHMWENSRGRHLSNESIEPRSNEVGTILGVMAGKKDACYDDTNYFRKDNFPNRVQRGSKNGLLGIATCPVLDAESNLFTGGGSTGILLKEAIPVFVSYEDSWSLYYDNESDIPDQDAWEEKCIQTDDWGLSHHMLRDDAVERNALAGKLGIFNCTRILFGDDTKYSEVLDVQIPEGMDSMPPYLLLDPLSPEVHEKAKLAYSKLIELLYSNQQKAPGRYQEVDVNASLEHAAGIIARNSNEAIEVADLDDDSKWSEILESRGNLAQTLYQACIEHAQLSEALKENGIGHTPTIIIQQANSKNNNLIHFPPTQRNKQIIEGILKNQGHNLPRIDVAVQEQKNNRQANQRHIQQTHPRVRQGSGNIAQR